jgi:hypothetical protein
LGKRQHLIKRIGDRIHQGAVFVHPIGNGSNHPVNGIRKEHHRIRQEGHDGCR